MASVHVDGIATEVSTAPYVITTEEGKFFRRNIYEDHYKPAVVKAGRNPKLDFHALRHGAGSIASSPTYANASSKVVQNLLRHSTEQVTTEIYTHYFAKDFDRLRDSLQEIYTSDAAQMQHEPDSRVKSMAPRRNKKAG